MTRSQRCWTHEERISINISSQTNFNHALWIKLQFGRLSIASLRKGLQFVLLSIGGWLCGGSRMMEESSADNTPWWHGACRLWTKFVFEARDHGDNIGTWHTATRHPWNIWFFLRIMWSDNTILAGQPEWYYTCAGRRLQFAPHQSTIILHLKFFAQCIIIIFNRRQEVNESRLMITND